MSVTSEIDSYIEKLSLNHNRFYELFEKNELSHKTLKLIFRQYYYYIRSFPKILAGLSHRVDSEEVRLQLARTVVSELGDGVGLPHFKMFEKVLESVGIDIADFDDIEICPCTRGLVEGLEELFLNASTYSAVGGHYTIEQTGLPMIRALYEGFRHYTSDRTHFDYFHLHLILECDHVAWISEAVKHYEADGHHDDVLAGGKKVADLLEAMWAEFFRIARADLITRETTEAA